MEASQERDEELRLRDLLDYPREDLDREIKDWLDMDDGVVRADLAIELLALANHGGGYLVFGFSEADDGYSGSGQCPFDLARYSQDSLNGVVARYAEPTFHLRVEHLNSTLSNPHVVVVVPGGHPVPIRSKRDGPQGSRMSQNVIYVRRPGPQSAPPQTAQDWEGLFERCFRARRTELVAALRELSTVLGAENPEEVLGLAGVAPREADALTAWVKAGEDRLAALMAEHLADEEPSRYENGSWIVAYEVVPKQHPPLALQDFIEILREVAGSETGWPPWWVPTREGITPYPYEGLVECWLVETHFADAAHSDFWRADPAGRMFLLRGYQEDSTESAEPGTQISLTLPTWRIGECLLHAERFARRLGEDDSSIHVLVRWRGLQGRLLTTLGTPDRFLSDNYRCHQDVVESTGTFAVETLADALPEAVRALVGPLYAAFNFFNPPGDFYAEELTKMRERSA
jgi:transcriptional regulator with XRE-family HTH domain